VQFCTKYPVLKAKLCRENASRAKNYLKESI